LETSAVAVITFDAVGVAYSITSSALLFARRSARNSARTLITGNDRRAWFAFFSGARGALRALADVVFAARAAHGAAILDAFRVRVVFVAHGGPRSVCRVLHEIVLTIVFTGAVQDARHTVEDATRIVPLLARSTVVRPIAFGVCQALALCPRFALGLGIGETAPPALAVHPIVAPVVGTSQAAAAQATRYAAYACSPVPHPLLSLWS